MRELSLHILDIVQNSLVAEANFIEIFVNEDVSNDILEISIKDNGKGMSQDQLERVIDPFFTSRTTRRVGLGIPLFKANAEACNGTFTISSKLGQGTEVYASFQYSHIDRVPLGNIISTIITIISGSPELNLIFRYGFNGQQFLLNTEEIKETIEDVPINNPLVLDWIMEFLSENINRLRELSTVN